MAIVVEQEKKSTNWFYILTGVLMAVLLLVAAYYLFFAKPEIINIVVPTRLDTSVLSEIRFDPQSVINESTFRSLRPYGTEPTPGEVGRTNPFAPF